MSVRSQKQSSFEQSIWDYGTQVLVPDLTPVANFSRSSSQSGAYLQDTLHELSDRLKITAAVRADHFAATGQSVVLPHLDAKLNLLSSTQFSAAVGQYAQFPSLEDLYGEFGTPNLRAERSTHEVLALDHEFTPFTRLHIEGYNRSDSDIIDSPLTQFRLLDNCEIANLLGTHNWRYYDYVYAFNSAQPLVVVTRENTMLLLPTAGFSIEF